jgi:hypothetical protein
MSFVVSRAQRRQLERDNAKMPRELIALPRNEWPDPEAPQLRVLRSREFLVQEFSAKAPAVVRLSVNRTVIAGDRWAENVTWDDLQRIKRECGYGAADAVEIYPSDKDVVNVANMRHLWILSDPIGCAWRSAQ